MCNNKSASETYGFSFSDAKLFKEKFEEAKKILSEKCALYNGKGDEENLDEEEDDESDKCEDQSASDDINYLEVTKRISELEVANEKD